MTSCFNIQSTAADWIESRGPCLICDHEGDLIQNVMCLVPLLLKHLYVLLEEGLKNCRTLFSKLLRLFELHIDCSIQ